MSLDVVLSAGGDSASKLGRDSEQGRRLRSEGSLERSSSHGQAEHRGQKR